MRTPWLRTRMMGSAIDVILVLVFLEGAALILFNRATGGGIPPGRLLPNMAAGFALMLAVRLALAREPDGLIAVCLLGSLVAHVLDLATRWRQRGSSHEPE